MIKLADYRTISIRAPAKGATLLLLLPGLYLLHFNPRSREGSDKS